MTPAIEQGAAGVDLRAALELRTGMDLRAGGDARYAHAIADLARSAGASAGTSLAALLRNPIRRPWVMDRMIRSLTVGETHFFRSAAHFRALRDHILPDILARRGPDRAARVWSAGCATGEEPYSVAILLDLDFPGADGAGVEIVASDLNAEFLARAQAGRYRAWSFRGTEIGGDTRYFRRSGELFQLVERIRDRVRFVEHNLAVDPYPPPESGDGFDIVFFRNVAIYFRPETIRACIARFASVLRPGGFLLLGEAETREDLFDGSGLAPVVIEGVTVLRKSDEPAFAPPPPPLSLASMDDRHAQDERRDVSDHEAAIPTPSPPSIAPAPAAPLPETAVDARRMLEDVLAEDPFHTDAMLLLAAMAEESGALDDSVTLLRRAIYAEPSEPMPYLLMGLLAARTGDADGTARHLRNALALAERLDPGAILMHGDGLTAGGLLNLLASLAAPEQAAS